MSAPTVQVAVKVDAEPFIESLRSLAAAMARVTASATLAFRGMRRLTAALPQPHAFTPNEDLCCTAARCGLGPEEHA